jgi:hypothetical protein
VKARITLFAVLFGSVWLALMAADGVWPGI